MAVALHAEGVDRNWAMNSKTYAKLRSPSMRRAWIEIMPRGGNLQLPAQSPSMRRAWIEMVYLSRIGLFSCVALHAEGVDRNIYLRVPDIEGIGVALHAEGVDRNYELRALCYMLNVALHAEGVDRNQTCQSIQPSLPAVALHAEGVDRNVVGGFIVLHLNDVALHAEGVDRNRKEVFA